MEDVMRKIFAILLILTMTFTLTGCKSSDYKTAVSLMESSENEQALSMFTELGDYKDSKIKACELLIKEGVKQINEYTDYYLPREINSKNYKYYEEALAAFKSLSAEDQALVSNSSDLKGSIYNNYLALKDLAELNSERNYYEKIAKECIIKEIKSNLKYSASFEEGERTRIVIDEVIPAAQFDFPYGNDGSYTEVIEGRFYIEYSASNSFGGMIDSTLGGTFEIYMRKYGAGFIKDINYSSRPDSYYFIDYD